MQIFHWCWYHFVGPNAHRVVIILKLWWLSSDLEGQGEHEISNFVRFLGELCHNSTVDQAGFWNSSGSHPELGLQYALKMGHIPTFFAEMRVLSVNLPDTGNYSDFTTILSHKTATYKVKYWRGLRLYKLTVTMMNGDDAAAQEDPSQTYLASLVLWSRFKRSMFLHTGWS